MTPDHARADQELDELLAAVRSRYIARSDACFDFDAGLADVRERADLPFARVPARRAGGGPGPLSAAVALACEQIEEFIAVLGGVLLPGPPTDLVGSQVQRAAEVLLSLRDEITAGSASLARAGAAVTQAGDALGEADLILRVELGTSLDDVVQSFAEGFPAQDQKPDAASWLHGLSMAVAAALSAQTQDAAAERAALQRPSQSRTPQGRRSRGGRAGG